jgi:hypothetical protein
MLLGCRPQGLWDGSLNKQVGTLTLDEALVELGPPTQFIEGDRVIVAIWRKDDVSLLNNLKMKRFYRIETEKVLRLAFDRSTRRLVAWARDSKIRNPEEIQRWANDLVGP